MTTWSSSLYLTYEELKLDHIGHNLFINFVVPYLWGIETDVTIKITAPALCCTLPMRNWNTIEGSLYVIQNLFRCTLPMRNWNCYLGLRWSFYWTPLSLYLTYEELKPLFTAKFKTSNWLYLTYEELKPVVSRFFLVDFFSCTLPMRNWNIKESRHIMTFLNGCTLPMRNWNTSTCLYIYIIFDGCTLPMRNWNTLYTPPLISTYSSVVPYLWGIETLLQQQPLHMLKFCCTLPMRNWNPYGSWYINLHRIIHVVPYLWGIETNSWSILIPPSFFSSCTLPMRNWNDLCQSVSGFLRYIVVPYLWGIETWWSVALKTDIRSCCTLPMRNWNEIIHLVQRHRMTVVPYLWGIET